MATEVSIHLFGDRVFLRKIQLMRHRAKNMSPVLKNIANEWLDIIEEQFATEGRRSGLPWKGLARATRFHRGSAHPILIDSGDLLIEMTDPGNIRVTDDSITLELPNDVVARSMQYGYHNVEAGQHVPARPMVKFRMIDEAKWRRDIRNYLVDGWL